MIETTPDEMLLLEAANSYTDWKVERTDDVMESARKSIVFAEFDATGARYAEPRPIRVPERMLPVLSAILERLHKHYQEGDRPEFQFAIGSLNFRGEVIRQGRYSLRRAEINVRGIPELKLGTRPETLLLDPEHRAGGLILICGETGSGKSTTARGTVKSRLEKYGGYALEASAPIEVHFEGFHGEGYLEQVDASARGYRYEVEHAMRKFPAATRSMFFMGEILNAEAASELVRLCPRGPLTISTIHADSPESAIKMLLAWAQQGGEVYARQLLGTSLRAVVHQRLTNGQVHVDCFKADDTIRNIIANPDAPLSGLANAIDAVKRAEAGSISRASMPSQARLRP